MRIFRISFLLMFSLAMVFSSCQKENVNDVLVVTPTINTEEKVEINPLIHRAANESEVFLTSSSDGLLLDCFSVDYPFSLIDLDGNVYVVNNQQDFDAISINMEIYLDFVYPINITYDGGEVEVINDVDALCLAFAECLPNDWEDWFPAYTIGFDNSCYSLDYPLSLIDELGEVTVVNNETEFYSVLADEILFFQFPLSLTHLDGNQITVNTIDELLIALVSCGGWEPADTSGGFDWGIGLEFVYCYTVSFPLDVITSDGSVVTVNNYEELCDLMLIGEFYGYDFPLTLTDADGNEFTVNSQEELDNAGADCPDYGGEISDSLELLLMLYFGQIEFTDCFTINYPFDITLFDGNSITINNAVEFDAAMNTNQGISGVTVPVSVTQLSDNSVVQLSSVQDLDALIMACE